MNPEVIAPGANILVRDAAWRVQRVDRTSTGSRALHVTGISEIVRDKEAIFLEEYEDSIEVLDPTTTQLVPDRSSNFQASLLYLESRLRRIAPTDDKLYVGPDAAMDLLDYQLEPAAQALEKPRQRILIADAVGLGKTLEAGILLSELIARGKAKRILVVAVKSMLTQFQKEMWSRFTIPLVRLDSLGLQRIRSRIPTNQNPFYHYDKSIISVDTLKQNNEFRTYLEDAHWDVIVIDEAHNVAVRGKKKSQRAKLAELLSHRSDSLIMLSATPHDGKARSFASLMNMLDPTAIADEDNYTPDDIDGLFIRRFKKDIEDQVEQNFPTRKIARAPADASPAEEALFDTFTDIEFDAIGRGGNMLFKTTLEKALLSSPAACIETIDNRLKRIEKTVDPTRYDRDVASLQRLRERLVDVDPGNFAKFRKLVDELSDDDSPFYFTGHFRDDRLVIFTERVATMKWLAEHLPRALDLDEKKVETLHGGMNDIDQQRIVEDFGKEQADLRLLIASDVASEGINLHYMCHRLVHFDIPWSLMVFQQRNGRIDRYGQTQTPHIAYFYTESDNDQIQGDTRILELLIEKDQQATENIGDPSALMGVYDIDEEEAKTAAAIEQNKTASAFEKELGEIDLMSKLLGDDEFTDTTSRPDIGELPGLYDHDFDYLTSALDLLRQDRPLDVEVDAERRRVAFEVPEDLQRRFEYLPDEVVPDSNRLILSSDTDAMQKAIADARGEETAWPELHYLWRLHPAIHWVNDRMEGNFGRHTAPVIVVDRGLHADQSLILVSGLIPNQKSQPLIHHWFGALFDDGELVELLDFDDVVDRTGLGEEPLPNRLEEIDTDALSELLPAAVDAATERMVELRNDFEDRINPRLQRELDRLEELKARQLKFAQQQFEQDGNREELDRKKRAIDTIFDDYFDWVEQTMTTERVPFIQVVAALTIGADDIPRPREEQSDAVGLSSQHKIRPTQ